MWLTTLKPNQPVVVALLSRFNLVFFWLLGLAVSSIADSETHIAQLHAHTPEELSAVLKRAEKWSQQFDSYPNTPIAVVLHGNEAKVFLKENYKRYQSLVDQAAKLDAFKVVDIQICERWMGYNNVEKNQLPAFIDTVPYGPGREEELIKAGYQSF